MGMLTQDYADPNSPTASDEYKRKLIMNLMLAQARIPAGMQKQIIENDPDLYGPKQQAPAAPQGQTFKGQVGTTVMPPEQEAQLRAMLRARGLSAAQIDSMVSAHKAAKGLR